MTKPGEAERQGGFRHGGPSGAEASGFRHGGSSSDPDLAGSRKPEASAPELVVLHEWGDVWKELRFSLLGLRSGEFEFSSPGLVPYGWVLSLLGSKASIRQVGTLGAVWVDFEEQPPVHLWIPGELEIPQGVLVQVRFG